MSFKGSVVDVGTSDTDLYEMPALSAGAVIVGLGNTTGSSVDVTIKKYVQADGAAKTLGIITVPAKDPKKWPAPIELDAGDIIQLVAASAPAITATATVVDEGAIRTDVFGKPRGAWSSIATYDEGNVAEANGTSYISLQDGNTNHDPETETDWWMINAEKGEPGSTVSPDRTVRAMDTTDSDPATSGYTNGATIGGVTVATGNLVLRNSSSHTARNGVWVVAASGGASRDNDFDTFDEHPGVVISVQEGTYADTMWLCTADVGGTLDTTAITWKQKDAAATDMTAGIVELATDTEARAATDTARAVTPANLAAATILQGKHTIALPASAWKAKASGGATSGTYQDIGVWSFNGTSATRIRCIIPMPKSFNEGTVTFKAYGVVDTGGASGNVAVWKMAAQAFSHDDPAWTTTDLSAGAQAANMSWTANDDVLISAESSAITIAGSPADGDAILFEFWRDPADASDNNTADFLIFADHIYITYNLPTDA